MVEGEDRLLLHPLQPGRDWRCVVGGEVRGDAGVQSADDAIQDLFVIATIMELIFADKAIFLVDKLPNKRAIIVCISLDYLVNVEVLSLVVFLVLDVPAPFVALQHLWRPYIDAVATRNAILIIPYSRNVLHFTSTDRAGGGLAKPACMREWTLLVDVDPDDSEELGLYQFVKLERGESVKLL